VTEITWHADDRLPFALCVACRDANGAQLVDVSIAWGNIALAEHGRTIDPPATPGDALRLPKPTEQRYRPALPVAAVTWASAIPAATPSATVLAKADPATALPMIALSIAPPGRPAERWVAVRDLLAADGVAPVFVVEPEDGGAGHLVFGDNSHGRAPVAGSTVSIAELRIGGGRAGTIAADALGHLLHVDPDLLGVENPMAATGGVDPEAVASARERAPQSWRIQKRAVTARDYADAAMTVAGVQRAGARMRWNGSWYAATIAIDPLGGVFTPALAQRVRDHLEPLRMAGHALRVVPARPVPLLIAFTLCLKPGHLKGVIVAAVRARFHAEVDARGELGLFHADRFRMGERFELSPLVAAAQAIDGVAHVQVTRFERADAPGSAGIDFGFLMPAPAELFELANDPSYPDRGSFTANVVASA
jgi:predicted phage baseplate assembly protein